MCKTFTIPRKTAEKQSTEPNTSAYSRKKMDSYSTLQLHLFLYKKHKNDNIIKNGTVAYI